MGIKGLWSVLTPFSEKKSLHEIRGEKIAIDLSGWVCDSQNVTDYHIQPRLYLRNLFFRTMYLLLADVNPIFVLEGDAPELKRDVMAARNALQFRGAAPKFDAASKKKPDVARKRFRGVLKECEALLRCMGVSCVRGHGEAEAACAVLNAQGVVDAVVSQDSDCFAYGARRVYRNFSVSNAAGGGALQGSIDCYDADKMFQHNGFGRNKMVALALLCGCDYGVGACGSAITTAVTFLHTIQDTEIIPRLLSWVSEPEQYEAKQRWICIPGRCDQCGHAGRTHGRNGCLICGTNKGCNDTGHKSKMTEVKRELSLRTRAISCGLPFPEPKVMKEFLNAPPENIDLDQLNVSTPSLVQFLKLMTSKLDWRERYCVEKFLPLLTRWHLQQTVSCKTIQPITIKKKRNPKGVPSYEVVWSDINGQYEGLIPDDQFEDEEDPKSAWTTVERQDLMKTFYADLVETYEESIKKPSKEKKSRARKKNVADDKEKPKRKYNRRKPIDDNVLKSISQSFSNINLSVNQENRANLSVKVNTLKRKLKSNKAKTQKPIDAFLAKRRKSMKKLMESLSDSVKNMSIKNTETEENVNQLNISQFKENIDTNINRKFSLLDLSNDDETHADLSGILDEIIRTAPIFKTATVNNNVVKLFFSKKTHTPRKSGFRKSVFSEMQNNCSTPRNSPASKNSSKDKASTSYFFDKLTDECDAFEMSMDCKNSFDGDITVNYSLSDLLSYE